MMQEPSEITHTDCRSPNTDLSSRKSQARLKQVCIGCRTSHLSCGVERPCTRCIAKGIPCVDAESKKRGRKHKGVDEVSQNHGQTLFFVGPDGRLTEADTSGSSPSTADTPPTHCESSFDANTKLIEDAFRSSPIQNTQTPTSASHESYFNSMLDHLSPTSNYVDSLTNFDVTIPFDQLDIGEPQSQLPIAFLPQSTLGLTHESLNQHQQHDQQQHQQQEQLQQQHIFDSTEGLDDFNATTYSTSDSRLDYLDFPSTDLGSLTKYETTADVFNTSFSSNPILIDTQSASALTYSQPQVQSHNRTSDTLLPNASIESVHGHVVKVIVGSSHNPMFTPQTPPTTHMAGYSNEMYVPFHQFTTTASSFPSSVTSVNMAAHQFPSTPHAVIYPTQEDEDNAIGERGKIKRLNTSDPLHSIPRMSHPHIDAVEAFAIMCVRMAETLMNLPQHVMVAEPTKQRLWLSRIFRNIVFFDLSGPLPMRLVPLERVWDVNRQTKFYHCAIRGPECASEEREFNTATTMMITYPLLPSNQAFPLRQMPTLLLNIHEKPTLFSVPIFSLLLEFLEDARFLLRIAEYPANKLPNSALRRMLSEE